MATTSDASNTQSLVELIAKAVYGLRMPASLKNRMAGACFGVTQEHHHAIIVLVQVPLNASAMALVRSVFESFIRGLWPLNCATEAEVQSFAEDKEPPPISAMLKAIEATNAYAAESLSGIKEATWRSMCAYAHTGSLQVQRWQTETAVEPTYSAAEIAEVLSFSSTFAVLSAVELASMAGEPEVAEQLTRAYSAYAQQEF